MQLTANLTRVTTDALEGWLYGHPVKTLVRLQDLATGERALELWDGNMLVGIGGMHCVDGAWSGTCSEYAGNWRVTGCDTALMFEDGP
jgi:hypothetical protein